ncbi:MAG: gliding motility-associated C-terminal domain-containing protein [Flavobacteriia bacterium]|nr:gliding motility-associated C-terminal domain-containing protein [Flavobacteriia bacterium]
MKNVLSFVRLIALISCISVNLFSQSPSTEYEIESILVDGCDGGNEGKNEMIVFRNGPNPLNIINIRIDGAGASGVIQNGFWPNGISFLGFCTTATSTNNIALLNTDIIHCGKLIEPIGGIIPANSKALIITSTDFTAIPSYFANLTDTLYVVFQCAGNTAGHFVNYNAVSSTRTLVLTNTITGYADTVQYDRSLLLNSSGLPGAGDGGAVAYEFNGTATYFNNGCQAPFVPISTSINPVGSIDCNTNSYFLTGNVLAGNYINVNWSGGTGIFSSPNDLSTFYTPGINEIGIITLKFSAVDYCNDTTSSTVSFQIYPQPVSNAGNDTSLCSLVSGQIGMSNTSGFQYSWTPNIGLDSDTISNPSIILSNNTNGPINSIYVVTTTVSGTGCSQIDSISITINPKDNPNFSIMANCNGGTAIITGLSGGTFSFQTLPNDGAQLNTSDGILTNASNDSTYSIAYTTNGQCPNSSVQSVTVSPRDDANFLLTPNCSGGTATVTGIVGGVFSFQSLPSDGTILDTITGKVQNAISGSSYAIIYATSGMCPFETTEILTIPITPSAPNINYSPTICSSEKIILTTTPNQGGIINWYIDYSLTTIVAIGDTLISENQAGSYSFFVIETLGNCQSEMTQVNYNVNNCLFEIPTAFTPDNDLTNDVWELKNIDINFPQNEVEIYNRWGNLIFKSEKGTYEKNKWNGTFNNEVLPVGSYYFIVKFNSSEISDVNGTVTIIKK